MRLPTTLRTVAVALSAAALAAAPAHASRPGVVPRDGIAAVSAAPVTAAVYRITITDRAGTPADARILVETIGATTSAVLVIGDEATAIGDLQLTESGLSGKVRTQAGNGRMQLTFAGANVEGTLRVGKQAWAVTGVRMM